MHGTIILHTHRLTLRQHVLQDAPVLHRFFGLDEAMYQYSGWNPYATEEMAMETMGRFLASYPDSRFYGWAIEHQGELVGTLGAYDYDPNRRTIEVGLSIFRPHWGQGFAAEALARVLDYLTGPEGIRQVIAWCAPDNIGSRRVMEKCGMVPTQGESPDRLYFRYQPPTYEIERKFLIAYPDVSILEAWPDMTRWEMVQTYLLSQPEDEVRVRQRTQDGISRWFHTVKRGEGIKRQEEEREITREEYQALRQIPPSGSSTRPDTVCPTGANCWRWTSTPSGRTRPSWKWNWSRRMTSSPSRPSSPSSGRSPETPPIKMPYWQNPQTKQTRRFSREPVETNPPPPSGPDPLPACGGGGHPNCGGDH